MAAHPGGGPKPGKGKGGRGKPPQPLVRYDVSVGKSPLGGRGVFAMRDFAPDEVVEVCPTLEVHKDDVSGKLVDYVFYGSDEDHRVLVCGYGMLYNSSKNANLKYVQDQSGDYEYVATRAIRAGEELFIDYGDEWWTDTNRDVTYRPPNH
eukprot:TRINITY_DN4483_c0_g1_i1.p1 TRINITY_DN4483_c0_g1~~TRINITY_DN4483_c0_g1_i1.p1  ORF type:complete len:158 (-),score=51.22 TRINITY_DN4483_c0_g1_i1:88-537(-)